MQLPYCIIGLHHIAYTTRLQDATWYQLHHYITRCVAKETWWKVQFTHCLTLPKTSSLCQKISKVMAPNKVTFNISIVSILLKAVTSRVIANVCCWLMIRLIKLDDVNWMLQPLEEDHNSNRQEIKCHMADLQCVAATVKKSSLEYFDKYVQRNHKWISQFVDRIIFDYILLREGLSMVFLGNSWG